VGPLLPDDVSRLGLVIERVRQAYPDQELEQYLKERDYKNITATFLEKRDGYCVFWRRGVGCTIHASVGGEHKPLVCQLFPLQLVNTEAGLRLGVRPTCLGDSVAWKDGPLVDGELIEAVAADSRGHVVRDEVEGEPVALRLLSIPDIDTGSVLSFLAGRSRNDVPDIEGWLEERLQELFVEFDDIGDQGPLHRETRTAQLLADFRGWHAGRATPRAWPEVPEQAREWVRDALQRLVFLRQTSLHPSLAWALLAYVAAARWAGAWAADGAGGFDPELMGLGFSTWLLILENPRLQRCFVQAGSPFAEHAAPSAGSEER